LPSFDERGAANPIKLKGNQGAPPLIVDNPTISAPYGGARICTLFSFTLEASETM